MTDAEIKDVKGKIYYGWVIVGILFCTTIFIMGTVNYGFATLIKPLNQEFGWSVLAINGAMSVRGIVQALCSPLVGWLADKLGPRWMLFTGAICMGLGMLLFSRVDNLIMFYIAFALMAFGMSCGDVTTTMTALAHWFKEKIGLASGIMYAGMGCSGFLVPVVVLLMEAVGSWRTAMMIIGILLIVIIAPIALLVRKDPQPYGWDVDGVPLADMSPEEREAAIVAAANAGKKTATSGDMTLGAAFKTRAFWLIAFMVTFSAFFISAVAGNIVNYGTSLGLPHVTAALLSTTNSGVSIVGRFGAGFLSDHMDVRRTVQLAFSIVFVGFIILIIAGLTGSMVLPFIGVGVFGLGYGGVSVIRAQLIRSYFGRDNYGKILGFVQAIGTLGVVGGPLLAGSIFDGTGSYQMLWIIYACFCFIPILFMFFLPPAPYANKAAQKAIDKAAAKKADKPA